MPRRRRDPAHCHRIRAAPLLDAQPQAGAQQGADPGPSLELRLRRPGQRRGALHLLSPQEDRRQSPADDSHAARRWLRSAPSRRMSQSGQPAPVPVAGPPRRPEPLPRTATLGRDTLGRQLVVRVTALVALAALLITTATALAAQQLLMAQLDRQLDAVTAAPHGPEAVRTADCSGLASRSAHSPCSTTLTERRRKAACSPSVVPPANAEQRSATSPMPLSPSSPTWPRTPLRAPWC